MGMDSLLVTAYDNFKVLAHRPSGQENSTPINIFKPNTTQKLKIPGSLNPAFVLKNPNKNIYYICNESIFGGSISTYSFKNLCLRQLGSVSSMGKSSCYLCFDPDMKNVININYWDSSITVHPLINDTLRQAKQLLLPKKENKIYKIEEHLSDRQSTSHHHSCVFYKNKLFVPDLGTDKIDIYNYDRGILQFYSHFNLKKGSGP